jgi:3-dehydroquinate synthase
MKCANYISNRKGLLTDSQYNRAQAVLNRFPLPELGKVEPEKVLEIVAHDKKNINGKLSFILLDQIGNAVINTEVSADDIVASLTAVT